MAPLAFGTQTAGSVIRPASYCGVVGYKPSFGLIPRAGVKGLSDSLDTIGVMARTVDDAAFLAGVLTGPAGAARDRGAAAAAVRLLPHADVGEAEPATMAALDHARAALLAAGARVDDIAVAAEHHGLVAAQETIHELRDGPRADLRAGLA